MKMNNFYLISCLFIFLFSHCENKVSKQSSDDTSSTELSDSVQQIPQDELLDTLESEPEPEPPLPPPPPPIDTIGLNNFIVQFFNDMVDKTLADLLLEKADDNFYFIHRPGTTTLIELVKDSNINIFKEEWITITKSLSKTTDRTLKRGLPKFNCDNGFNKSGNFYDLMPNPKELSSILRQAIKLSISYTEEDVALSEQKEKNVAIVLSLTNSELFLYLGRHVDNTWHLIALNTNKYDCGV